MVSLDGVGLRVTVKNHDKETAQLTMSTRFGGSTVDALRDAVELDLLAVCEDQGPGPKVH